jgi:hypothetical protein
MLTEGNSLRATTRMAGCSINTVSKLLLDVGDACAAYQDRTLRDLSCKTIEADEIWSFCYSKQRNVPEERKGEFGYGDVWTWVALDADSKLAVSWLVGERNLGSCWTFIEDLKGRVAGRIQLSTDAHQTYRGVVGLVFNKDEVDWAQLIKTYKTQYAGTGRYNPPACIGTKTKVRLGNPDLAKSQRATWSGRTSRCGCTCAASQGSPTASARRSRTTPPPWRSTSCTTTSPAHTRPSPTHTHEPPRWPQGSPITSGPQPRS